MLCCLEYHSMLTLRCSNIYRAMDLQSNIVFTIYGVPLFVWVDLSNVYAGTENIYLNTASIQFFLHVFADLRLFGSFDSSMN